jgi:chorismate dehydratase
MIRIGNINNLSARPFSLCAPRSFAEAIELTPAALGRRVLDGSLDVALVPTALLPSVEPFMEPAGPYGIACTGRVGSVSILSRMSVEDLLRRNGALYITPESRTSHLLFQVLCEGAHGQLPRMTDHAGEAEAWLYIGDEAVRQARMVTRETCITDLGEWWYARTSRPFVFARWMVRRSLDHASRELIQAWLEQNARMAEAPGGHHALACEAAPLFGDHTAAAAYYQHLRQRLTPADDAGQALFLQHITEYRLWSRSA